ncbi:MAG TPA: helix-turn-helix domain-containing protein [Candidatus Acidoferrales bacterium]|nr:helix-turn-helix domain-containing protein [Candidatus Acidoferrales bacterium]
MKHGEWYWVDKVIIQRYTKEVGRLPALVYQLLASMADQNQTCYPSQGYIAEMLGCSRWSVNKAVRKLKERGLIACAKAVGKGNTYRLLPPQMFPGGTGDVRSEATDLCENGGTNNNK